MNYFSFSEKRVELHGLSTCIHFRLGRQSIHQDKKRQFIIQIPSCYMNNIYLKTKLKNKNMNKALRFIPLFSRENFSHLVTGIRDCYSLRRMIK